MTLLHNIYNTIEDRLIVILTEECTRYQVNLECLSFDQYVQMIKLIEHFMLNINNSDKKYNSSPFKMFIQLQTIQFLTHYYDNERQRIFNLLDNEQWKLVKLYFLMFSNKLKINFE
jgi:hypothetical protein